MGGIYTTLGELMKSVCICEDLEVNAIYSNSNSATIEMNTNE